MNEELNSYIDSLLEDTMLAMDEFQTAEMAFTATVLEKLKVYLIAKILLRNIVRLRKPMVILLVKFMLIPRVLMAKYCIFFIQTTIQIIM